MKDKFRFTSWSLILAMLCKVESQFKHNFKRKSIRATSVCKLAQFTICITMSGRGFLLLTGQSKFDKLLICIFQFFCHKTYLLFAFKAVYIVTSIFLISYSYRIAKKFGIFDNYSRVCLMLLSYYYNINNIR